MIFSLHVFSLSLSLFLTALYKQKIFEVKGDIPKDLMSFLRSEFGKNLTVVDDEKDYVDVTRTDWYKKQKAARTPGKITTCKT